MSKCRILNLCNSNDLKSIQCFYKLQSIVNISGDRVASELLIDRLKLTSNLYDLERKLRFGSLCANALNTASKLSFEKELFINIERRNLCDIKTLIHIRDASISLCDLGVKLVIEITERNLCGNCPRIAEGLTFLRQCAISLAVDDYDYINYDFREDEVKKNNYYEYIKITMASNENELKKMNEFIKILSETHKIIIERIENEKEIYKIDQKYIWGMQGFAFCNGVSLPHHISS
ncbi:hypothetical protein JK628_20790 [Shewanella sp. KX20019]|uniref:hypothetical protein n=1 Tax=Shewanella sp. KX20019 TaxID=2803864 RepID=UPI001927B8B3|nr:hypothetical protein [Shewanella sp. KX20019]QQX79908.1 hypothetical protein JK628_20790 [Shewanella sp. KX20019]